MTTNFLHEDKHVPPDETIERDAPMCGCGQQMWLVRVETHLSDFGIQSNREYECGLCGKKRTLRVSERLAPG